MFADIQNSGDPDCEAWKKRMQGAQGKINAIGEKLKTELASANQTIEKYESQQNISCDENCDLKLGKYCYYYILYHNYIHIHFAGCKTLYHLLKLSTISLVQIKLL